MVRRPLWYADRCGTQTEDINHGQIDIDFAALAFRDGVVFRGRDMERFARTFTRNIMATTDSGVPTVWKNVDGTGGTELLGYEYIAPGWIPLAYWDRDVFTHNRDIYAYRQPDPATIGAPGYIVFCTANLNWFPSRVHV